MKKELIAIVFATLMIATAFAIFGGISSTGVNSWISGLLFMGILTVIWLHSLKVGEKH